MPVSVTMPQLGESVVEGTVTRWLKQVGDVVALDEPLLEISTDKVDTEIPSPAAGILLSIDAQEDEVVAVGGQLALIGSAGESPSAAAPSAAAPSAAAAVEVAAVEVAAVEPVVAEPVSVIAEPVAEPVAASTPPSMPQFATPASAPAAGAASRTPVVLPALGESVTEGTVTRWLKAVGDVVALDEPLVEISTDKVDTELPSPAAGVLLEITIEADSVVAVGGQLGVIGGADSAAPAASAPAPASPPVAAVPAEVVPAVVVPAVVVPAVVVPAVAVPAAVVAVAAQAAPAVSTATATADSDPDDSYVTPLVRKLAADNHIDLARVTGTGVGGRIRKSDVLEAVEAAKQATPVAPRSDSAELRGRTEKLSRLRRVIADRMVESLQVSAQLTTVVEVDVTRIAQLRAAAKSGFEAKEGAKLSFLPFFAKATIEALVAFPQVNASIDTAEGTVTYHEACHLGIAVDTERGLLVPVIHNAGALSIGGLARGIADLAGRTRTGKVSPDELSGGTFTLTNTGSRGALFDTPIINQPQVAILGTGAVVKRPVVVTDDNGLDSIAVRSMVYLALTYDHRLVDGADAARFLVTIKDRLEGAAFETELGL